jgi:hypothetical protein
MPPRLEIFGVHPIDASEPCHLVEVLIQNNDKDLNLPGFTQPIADQPQDNWQVPWDERFLSLGGTEQIVEQFEKPNSWTGDLRVAFFFHYLDLGRPILTPFGEVELPAPTEKPVRLDFIEYEEPD